MPRDPPGAGGWMEEGDAPSPALRALPGPGASASSVPPAAGTGIQPAAPTRQRKPGNPPPRRRKHQTFPLPNNLFSFTRS